MLWFQAVLPYLTRCLICLLLHGTCRNNLQGKIIRANRNGSRKELLSRSHQWQLDEAGVFRRVIDFLRSLAIVGWFRPEDAPHKSLRVAVIQREPARVHLHHDLVAGQEDAVCGWQLESVEKRLIHFERLGRFQAFAVAQRSSAGFSLTV